MSKIDKATPAISVQDTLAELDRLIHEPARLAILTVLAASIAADFTFLATATGLTRGNLSVQLSRLEDAGFITLERSIENRRTLTLVSLTATGRSSLTQYWEQMESLREHTAVKRKARKTTPIRSTLVPAGAS